MMFNKTKISMKKLSVAMAISAMFVTGAAHAAAGDSASYTASGSAGNWTLDFTFTNGLGINNLDIYFVGINLPGGSYISAPSNWADYGGYIGFNITPLNYGTSIPDMIQDGESLSGFKVLDTSASVPLSVDWFAYHNDWTGGSANYAGNYNPVFFGTASLVPEPETYAMLLAGLGLLGFMARRRKESIV